MNDESGAYSASVQAASEPDSGEASHLVPPVPDYLRETYWWAYLHPNAIRVFEREWLVNWILWGNMRRLTESVLDELAPRPGDAVLQLACVYGRFSERLVTCLEDRGANLHLVDIAAIQLDNARRKLAAHADVRYHRLDSSSLTFPAGRFASTVLFFLLHEQPQHVRRRTLQEALRVTRPGGKVIVVDYHRPSRFSPWRYLMLPVLRWLEPFALDLWRHPIRELLPRSGAPVHTDTRLFFGGLYQKTVITRVD